MRQKHQAESGQNIEWLDIDALCFDPENPRLPEGINGADQPSVLEWMLRQGDSIELIASIGATGYSIAEPLLVTEDKKKTGQYTVVEGNRRLAALKLLNSPEIAPIKQKSVLDAVSHASIIPSTVPVIIYHGREDAFAYLGYRHIAGIKAWGPLQKARYTRQLFDYYKKSGLGEAESFNKIATVAATKAYAAKKSLTTLAIYERAKEAGYWEIKNISSASIDFSVLGTSLNHNSIVNFIGLKASTDYSLSGLQDSNVQELFQWLFASEVGDRSRVSESRQLSTLAKVVATPQALAAFRAGRTLQDSAIYTDEVDETFQKLITNAMSLVEQAEDIISRVTPSEIHLDMLRDMQANIKRMGVSLRTKQTADEDEF